MNNTLSWNQPLLLNKKDVGLYFGTFALYFLAAKLGHYLLFTFETAPALIWPPVGIAIFAMLLGGYRMWVPIFLAQYLASLTTPTSSYALALIPSVAYSLQAIASLYVLRLFDFDAKKTTLRNTLILIGIAFFLTIIAPVFSTIGRYLSGTLLVDATTNITRIWGAGIFSVLVTFPFFALWYRPSVTLRALFPDETYARIELAAAFVVLFVINHFLFWTTELQFFGISIIFLLPAVLIWFSLRMHPRWLALAILLSAIYAIAGTFIAQPSANPIGDQLLTVEIYVGLVAAMFLVLSSVVFERSIAYTKLKEAYNSTLLSERAKNEFIAILAHELRNPLAPIVSSLELLKITPQTPESLKTIEIAEEHTSTMRRLLDDLLDTVRLSQNKFVLHKEKVNVRDIVENSIASVRELIEKKGLTLSLNVEKRVDDATLHADSVRIKQIFINLLSNAAKYTPLGGNIKVSCKVAGENLIFSVKDDGLGIEEDKLESLFEPFKQFAAHVNGNRDEGLGIGLYITKQLVTMHEGKIEVYSEGAGKGSTFSVYLPLAKALPATEQFDFPIKNSVKQILLVDDNQPLVAALKKLLTYHGHTVRTAYSGSGALAELASFSPDVIFLDIGMPDLNGYETARRMREAGWNGILVALTGYGQTSDREKSEKAGFDYHMVKPVGIDDLNRLLSEGKRRGHFSGQPNQPDRGQLVGLWAN